VKKKEDGLTLKEEIFVQELIKNKTLKDAYLIAYPHTKKWTPNAIYVNASRLFNNPKINLRYEQLKQELIKQSEEECIIDAKEILREYKKIAFSDIKDFLEYKTEENMVQCGTGEYPRLTQTIRMKPSDDVDGAAIQEVSINQKGTFSFKLHNKLKALDKLAEYVGLIKPEGGDDEELKDDGLVEQLEKITDNIWDDEEEEDGSEED